MTPLVLDIETNQLSPFKADSRILYIGLWYPGKDKPLDASQRPLAYLHEDKAFAILSEALNKGVPILGHHTKFDLLWLASKGLVLPKEYGYEDSMYLSYVSGRKKLSLDYLVKRVLGKESHKGSVNRKDLENSLFQEEIKDYCIQDVHATYEIWEAQSEKRARPLYKFLCDLSRAVLSMEHNGLYIAKDTIKTLEKELTQQIRELENKIKATGFKVNLGSPEQSLRFLQYFGYVGGGTDSNTLLLTKVQLPKGKLRNGLELVLEYRKVAKLLSTFVPLLLNNYGDRLHSGYSLVPYEGQGAKTGRLASVPNAQNFPAVIRKALEAPEGYEYLKADYGQIELRIGALLANESRMLRVFDEESGDPHADTTEMIKSFGKVSVTDPKALRVIAKSINFGAGMFGAGAERTQQMFAKAGVFVPIPEVKSFLRGWKKLYPRISQNANRFRDKAEKEGTLRTPTGRKRRFEGGNDINAAANYVIQSLSADICLTGLNQVSKSLCDADIKLVCSVHDSLVLEYPKSKNFKGLEKEVKRLMTTETKRDFAERFGYEIKVPITVDTSIEESL